LNFSGQVAAFSANKGQVAVSFAAHPSGSISVPWNGSTGSFSSGTIGSPVWKGDATGKIGVFPRNNVLFNGLGSASTQRNYLATIADENYSGQFTRSHFIATEDSFTICTDSLVTEQYNIIHFGSYTVRSGTVVDLPYAMIRNDQGSAVVQNTSVYGITTAVGTYTPIARDGGIAHPTLSASGTRQLAIMTVGGSNIDNFVGGWNFFVNSGSYDQLPLWVAMREAPGDFGILGTMNNIWCAFGIDTHTISPTSGTACFSGLAGINHAKFLTQWTGSAPGSSNPGRDGRDT
jgi:hypothetical protein